MTLRTKWLLLRGISYAALLGYVVLIDGFWETVLGAVLVAIFLGVGEIADEAKRWRNLT